MKRKIGRLFLLGVLLAVLTISAGAAETVASGNCYGSTTLTWVVDDEGTLTISGTGVLTSPADKTLVPWNTYISQIKKIVVSDQTVQIGTGAFHGCSAVTQAVLPEGLTSIGEWAFGECDALNDITLPGTLTTIGACAFYGCDALPSVTVPDTVTSLGGWAFAYCPALTKAKLPKGLTTIPEKTFLACSKLSEVVLPEAVTSIGSCAFQGSGLTEMDIPEGVTVIGSEAFSTCPSLARVTLPQSLTNLGEKAFYDCDALEEVWLHEGLKMIEDYAFADCLSLRTVVFQGKTTALYANSFAKNSDELTLWGYAGIGAQKYAGDKKINFCVLKDTGVCEDGLSWALSEDGALLVSGSGAMQDYSADTPAPWAAYADSITALKVSEGVTGIGDCAFENITAMQEVELPDGLLSIGDESFFGCTGVTGLVVPDSVTEIGKDAFQHCAVSVDGDRLQDAVSSQNVGDHHYINAARWTDPMYSYLMEGEDDSLIRVEAVDGAVIVENYAREGRSVRWESGFRIAYELPIFGGCYAGEDCNFLVFGAANPEESDEQEVLRVVKYSKDWTKRLSSASLYGGNTTTPFRAGSLRFAEYGGYLYIRTCHEMYTSWDGNKHQANMMLVVDMVNMAITDSQTAVYNNSIGYVSHSFNQFIAAKNGVVTAVDHGDAGPRSVALFQYSKPAGEPKLIGRASMLNVLPIAGNRGANDTGVTVGAFEATDTAYLVAGTSVVQDENFASRIAHNVFLSATPTDDFTQDASRLQWITDYQEDASSCAAPPYLVQVEENKYLLVWSVRTASLYYSRESGTISYAYVDADGNLLSEVKSFKGYMSDCTPIAVDGGVMWYVTGNSVPTFYFLKGDALVTTNTADQTGTLELHTDATLVRACYDTDGSFQGAQVTEISDGNAVSLAAYSKKTNRYFLLEARTLIPIALPFH